MNKKINIEDIAKELSILEQQTILKMEDILFKMVGTTMSYAERKIMAGQLVKKIFPIRKSTSDDYIETLEKIKEIVK